MPQRDGRGHGSGWPVNDEQALSMAEVLYRVLLGRETIGKAMQDARRAIFDLQMESTWGAYQHYGDPNDTVLRVVA